MKTWKPSTVLKFSALGMLVLSPAALAFGELTAEQISLANKDCPTCSFGNESNTESVEEKNFEKMGLSGEFFGQLLTGEEAPQVVRAPKALRDPKTGKIIKSSVQLSREQGIFFDQRNQGRISRLSMPNVPKSGTWNTDGLNIGQRISQEPSAEKLAAKNYEAGVRSLAKVKPPVQLPFAATDLIYGEHQNAAQWANTDEGVEWLDQRLRDRRNQVLKQTFEQQVQPQIDEWNKKPPRKKVLRPRFDDRA